MVEDAGDKPERKRERERETGLLADRENRLVELGISFLHALLKIR